MRCVCTKKYFHYIFTNVADVCVLKNHISISAVVCLYVTFTQVCLKKLSLMFFRNFPLFCRGDICMLSICLFLVYFKPNSVLTETNFAIDLLNASPPLVSRRKIKAGIEKPISSFFLCFFSLSSLHCRPRQPCSNSEL